MKIGFFHTDFSKFRANAAGEDMNRLQKYSRIVLLAYVHNFVYWFRDDLREKLKIVPPYHASSLQLSLVLFFLEIFCCLNNILLTHGNFGRS